MEPDEYEYSSAPMSSGSVAMLSVNK